MQAPVEKDEEALYLEEPYGESPVSK